MKPRPLRKTTGRRKGFHGSVISNRQSRVPLNVKFLRPFLGQTHSLLRLRQRRFDLTLVDDRAIARLNRSFRGIARPTDVLSFPWQNEPEKECEGSPDQTEFAAFLGDIVISVETARRNAAKAGLSLQMEIRQLVLHGVLHLLGYDHETDRGEMAALEMALRRKLGISD